MPGFQYSLNANYMLSYAMSQFPDDLRAGFGYHLLQLARRWRRFDEKVMARHGYTDVSWVPLLHLHDAKPMMQKELAARCGLDTSSLVRLLNLLAEQGLLARRQNPDDGRAWLLELTEQGQAQAGRVAQILGEAETAKLQGVPAEQIQAFLKATQHIEENLHSLQEENRDV